MWSLAALESPGRWRFAVVVVIFAICFVAPLRLLLENTAAATEIGDAFWNSLVTGFRVTAMSSTVSFVIGVPWGVVAALYEFPARKLLMGLMLVPLLLPSTVWAVGWLSAIEALDAGTSIRAPATIAFLMTQMTAILPIVAFVAVIATAQQSKSQRESSLVAGGQRLLVRFAIRSVLLVCLVAAALGGATQFADPGAAQIFGVAMPASQILISFAASFDSALAARQCLTLSAVVLAVSLPLVTVAAPRLAAAALGRQALADQAGPADRLGVRGTMLLGAPLLLLLAPPLTGMLSALAGHTSQRESASLVAANAVATLQTSLSTAMRTSVDTLVYACGAAVVASVSGLILAIAVGRDSRARTAACAACIAVFAIPPAATALGIAVVGASAPAELDFLLRSRFTVASALGLHLFPVAALISLRAWAGTVPSWAYAAAVHGVGIRSYLWRVLWPALRASFAWTMLVVALLAAADVSTVLLLSPPGRSSFALSIVTLTANAPEALAASLSLVYIAATLAAVWLLMRLAQALP